MGEQVFQTLVICIDFASFMIKIMSSITKAKTTTANLSHECNNSAHNSLIVMMNMQLLYHNALIRILVPF